MFIQITTFHHLVHYFDFAVFIKRLHVYLCVRNFLESLNLLASKTFFYRKIQLYLVQIHRDNFSNVKQPANYGVNTKRIATLLFPSYMQELKKCCWTQCFIRRGFTHAFLIRIIFHRDLSPLTSAAGRSSLKCISSRSQP